MQKNNNKAQGTIEYIVIIAIVVVISLVVVGLATGSLDSAIGVNEKQSKLYWSTQPLAITDSVTDTNGNLLIVLKNNTNEVNTINSITINGVTSYPDNFTLSMSETKAIYLNKQNQGATKSNQITITYTNQNGITKNQTSTTKLAPTQIPTITPTQTTQLLLQNNCFDWNTNAAAIHPICTCDDLNTIDYNATTRAWAYSLQNNLDFKNCNPAYREGSGWKPIGDNSNRFNGSFQGNNHTIKNLYIYRPTTDYVGLFGYISNSTGKDINNLGLIDSNITGQNYVGGISGLYGKIYYCYNTGTIYGSTNTGGINGTNGTVTNSYNTGTITGGSYLGGLIGAGGTANYSYNTGTISGSSSRYVGGLIGNQGIANYSYNTGTVNGLYEVGGIVGINGTSNYSYNTGTVNGIDRVAGIIGITGTANYSYNTGTINGSFGVGGILGATGTVNNSYNTGTINAGSSTGGILGDAGTTNNSYNTGNVNGNYNTGGINGTNGTVTNSYNTGRISGGTNSNYTGGIIGSLGTVNNSYNTGTVMAANNVGGITGYFTTSNSITNSFSTGQIIRTTGTATILNGAIGLVSGGTIINIHWYDSNTNDNATICYQGGDANCTKYTSANYTSLYSATNPVYTTAPVWDTSIWTWRTDNYPKLTWQQ